ncbi:MAG: FeoB-associated Cys-rich membrane protein [Erysipelotrichaceae bacterium]|nr:FeoB-associated Cys-rich membrane protein [Erysipelotrichaceae bacterium]MDY5252379.1 FeoB-associated Cys-rich membrane protein [Erysipelotrichaceae bacterium]
MIDLIVLAIIAACVGFASYYLYRKKKQGAKCIGCPYAKECTKKQCGG